MKHVYSPFRYLYNIEILQEIQHLGYLQWSQNCSYDRSESMTPGGQNANDARDIDTSLLANDARDIDTSLLANDARDIDTSL